ncbi:MAG: hypothetical protein MJ089_04840 [Ruminococcus sp.]|nr:hypothetical protein [Ruminococcus sp.]
MAGYVIICLIVLLVFFVAVTAFVYNIIKNRFGRKISVFIIFSMTDLIFALFSNIAFIIIYFTTNDNSQKIFSMIWFVLADPVMLTMLIGSVAGIFFEKKIKSNYDDINF